MSAENANSDSTPQPGVPKAVVGRLSLYLRELQHLITDGKETTSSTQLGSLLGFSDAQVRKDLAYFGQFGYPGIGYRCAELVAEIKKILGTDREWPVALIGAGNLGRALLGYKGFDRQGFEIVAAFDIDEAKVGSVIQGVEIFPYAKLAEVAGQRQIKLAMITVPAEHAQDVAQRVADAGIDGILNFAPVTLSLSNAASVQAVDLAIELEQLTYAVVKSEKSAENDSGDEGQVES